MIGVHHEIDHRPEHVNGQRALKVILHQAYEYEHRHFEYEEQHGHADNHYAHAPDLSDSFEVLAIGLALGQQDLVDYINVANHHDYERQYDLSARVYPCEDIGKKVVVFGVVGLDETL